MFVVPEDAAEEEGWRLQPDPSRECCPFKMAAVIAFFFPQKELFSILILLNPLLKSAMRMEVIFVNYKVLSNKSTAALKFAWYCYILRGRFIYSCNDGLVLLFAKAVLFFYLVKKKMIINYYKACS